MPGRGGGGARGGPGPGPDPDLDGACAQLREAADLGPAECAAVISAVAGGLAEAAGPGDPTRLLVARARELVACLDVALGPAVAQVEAEMTAGGGFASGTVETLARTARDAVDAQGPGLRRGVTDGVRALGRLWGRLVADGGAPARRVPNPPSPVRDSFVSVRLTQVIAMAHVVCLRDVTARARGWYEERLGHVGAVTAALGVTPREAAVALDHAGRLFLWFLAEGARGGDGRAKVSLARERVPHGLLGAAADLAARASAGRVLLFPCFVDDYVETSRQAAATQGDLVRELMAGGGGPAGGTGGHGAAKKSMGEREAGGAAVREGAVMDAGEGHGPRKEMFGLYGEAVTLGAGVEVRTALQSMAATQLLASALGGGGGEAAKVLQWHPGAGACWFVDRVRRGRACRGPTAGELDAAPSLGSAPSWERGASEAPPAAGDPAALLGLMLGLSLHNRCPVGVALPALALDVLVNGPGVVAALSVPQLRDFDPALAEGVAGTLALGREDLAAVLSMEDLDPGTTAEEYVAQSLASQLLPGGEALVGAAGAALVSALGGEAGLGRLGEWSVVCSDLARVAGGEGPLESEDFDFREAFRVVHDAELMAGPGAALRDALWEVVGGLPADGKRQFLKFVTGSDRLPAPRSEQIKVEVPFTPLGPDEWRRQLGMAPQSHTCSNTLELPDYAGALARCRPELGEEERRGELVAVLRDRLALALANAYSYGLDEV